MERCHGLPAGPVAKPRELPIVFVAAAGGGIRAAFWTESVLDAITEGTADPPGASSRQCARQSLFVLSSASGGSLGVALWAVDDKGSTERARGARLLADGTALSALAAGLFIRDTVRSISGREHPWDDRATLVEQAWGDRLAGSGLNLAGPFLDAAGPASATDAFRSLMMLNSTDLLTQCRVVMTRLSSAVAKRVDDCDDPEQISGPTGDPLTGAYYATDFTSTSDCPDGKQTGQMSVATAALLSGRFPFVTPTGTLYRCDGDKPRILQLADGGYEENTGMVSAMQEWLALQPLVARHNHSVLTGQSVEHLAGTVIVPTFVIISSSYRSQRDVRLPEPRPEILLPVGGNHAEEALVSPARLELDARYLFCAQGIPGIDLADVSDAARPAARPCSQRFHVFAPTLQPEITAPLGWTLSEQSMASLDHQLEASQPGVDTLRTLLTTGFA
jgi:hypothetical protein